jgi:hypothetical protein
MDTGLIGSVMNALPIDRMISGPLQAMITAQIQASKAYADFLLTVCIKDGKAISVEFDYDETLVNTEGEVTGVQTKKMRIPLLAAISHPNICVTEGSIDFELTVSQSEETHTSTEAEGGFEAKIGWGPFSVTMHGSVSHKSEQTRKTDTRAKYSVSVKAQRLDPPEALMRVIDFLTDSATKPVTMPNTPPATGDAINTQLATGQATGLGAPAADPAPQGN